MDIIPFASAYTLISGFTTINSYDQIDQIKKIKTFKKFKRLVKFEKMLLVIFLGILLINSVFFFNLNHKSSELNFEANELNGMLKQISTLEKEINKEKLLIEKSGLSKSTITSYYADRIASIRPKGIIFTRMSFNPLIKEKNINEIIFNKDIIQILGTTENSLLFNEWTEAIKEYKWVDKIDLISYKNQVEYNGNDFEIKIHIIKDVF